MTPKKNKNTPCNKQFASPGTLNTTRSLLLFYLATSVTLNTKKKNLTDTEFCKNQLKKRNICFAANSVLRIKIMKNKIFGRMKSLTLLLTLAILFSNSIRATEKVHSDNNLSNRINLNLQSNFFIAEYGYYSSLNPGFEFLYEFVLTDKISVLSGLNYIYSRHYNDLYIKVSWRTFGHELFFPLLTKLSISRRIYFTTGIYAGYLLSGKVKYRNNITYTKIWQDVTEDYALNKTFSADLFAGLAYSQSLKNNLSVDIIPFAKFKLTDNWLERYRTKTYFGIKINFSIDTKNLF